MSNRIFSFLVRLCVVAFLLIALGSFALAANTPTEVVCSEIPLYLDREFIGDGYLIDGTTYVPALSFCRTVMERDFDVTWNQQAQFISLDAGDVCISLNLGDTYFTANERCFYLPEGVYNVNGTLLMPIRTLAKVFNTIVIWNDDWSIDLYNSEPEVLEPGNQFYDEESLYWLSRVISSEAGLEPFDGMIGVGNVVLNRVNDTSGFFPDTVKDVIFQPGQFSVVTAGTIYNEPFEEAVAAAKLCLEGYNVVGESLYFLNPAISSNYWFRATQTYVTTIRNHEFYA